MELLFVFVLIAIGAIGASTLFGVALGRAAARGDAELEDRRMHALAMRGRAIRAARITSAPQTPTTAPARRPAPHQARRASMGIRSVP
jgi:hypothetical protein